VRRRLLLALLLAPATARAHEPGLSRGEYRVDDDGVVTSQLVFARRELAERILPGADTDSDGQLGEFELLAVDAELRRQLLAGLELSAGPDRCDGAVTRVAFVEEDGLQVDLRHSCPRAPLPAVTLRWPLLARLSPAHRHLGRLVFTAAPVPGDSPSAASAPVPGDSPSAASAPVPGDSLPASAPVPEATPAIDFVAHARRSALTIRRPPADAPTRAPAPAAPTSVATPVVPAPPPSSPPVPARPWPWLLAFALALVTLAVVRALRRRRRR